MNYDLSIPDIARLLAQNADSVAPYLYPNGQKVRNNWEVGSIGGEAGKSLKICVAGPKKGVWADFADGRGGDLVELWSLSFNKTKGEALKDIRQYLSLNRFSEVKPQSPVVEQKKVERVVQLEVPINPATLSSLQQRLFASKLAMGYLGGKRRGLDQDAIRHFGLGLTRPYTDSSGTTASDVIAAPLRSSSGQLLSRLAFITVPGVSVNPLDSNGWMKGEPACYYADSIKEQTSIFICEGLKDVWRHWMAMKEAGVLHRVLLVSSTHGCAIPQEWQNSEYWAKWKNVYLGHDSDAPGDKMAERLTGCIKRPVKRVRVPEQYGKDWTDFWQNSGTFDAFKQLVISNS